MNNRLTKNFNLEDESPRQKINITYQPAEKVMNLNLNGLEDDQLSTVRVADTDPISIWPSDEVKLISQNTKIELYSTNNLARLITELDSDYKTLSTTNREFDSLELLRNNLELNRKNMYNRVIKQFKKTPELREIIQELGAVTPIIKLNPKDWAESLLAYRWKPGNEDFLIRKSRVTASPRQLKRNLEANLGIHILRSDEFEQYVGLAIQMYSGEGYPATDRSKSLMGRIKHTLNPDSQFLNSLDEIIDTVNNGRLDDRIYSWKRPETTIDKLGNIETEYNNALTLSRYNRPNTKVEEKIKSLAKKYLGTNKLTKESLAKAYNLARKEITSNQVKRISRRVKIKRRV